jgi:iron complex outermembrane recepter protein
MSHRFSASLRPRSGGPPALASLLYVLLSALVPPAAYAQGSAPLTTLTIEELLEVDVTSVSRGREPVASAPAAIDVITGDEIRRSGVTTLPEALRLATGLMVARADGTTWAISARGFTITTANKLLVLIDGRSVYTPLFSGVFWDVQDVLLQDVDRIEVIRGPGATLWGANAVNGVINVITRPASRTMDWQVQLATGNEERVLATARYGDELGDSAHYRVYTKVNDIGPDVTASGVSAQDHLRRGQFGGRLDWAPEEGTELTLQGDGYRGELGVFERPDSDIHGWNLLGRYRRQVDQGAELQVQWYYDRTFRSIAGVFEEDRGTWDVDVQFRARRFDRHALLVGGGYRLTRDETDVPPAPDAAPITAARFDPASRDASLVSAFVQDEITFVPGRLFAVVGARLEHNAFTGVEVQPTARIRFVPRPRSLLWGAVSRAVRTPARLDADARFTGPAGDLVLRGSEDIQAERVIAYEAGYRVQPVPRLSVDLAGFHNRYDRLRSIEPGAPSFFANGLRGHANGLETEVNLQATPWMRWQGSWTWFAKHLERRPGSADPTAGSVEGNDPRHQVGIRATLNVHPEIELDGFLRHVTRLPLPEVPAYTELDLRAAWRPTADLEIAFVGRNLLHDRHPEFGAPTPDRVEIQRSAYARLRVSF